MIEWMAELLFLVLLTVINKKEKLKIMIKNKGKSRKKTK